MKIEASSLIAEGKKATALMRQKRDAEVTAEGKGAANLVFHSVTLANCIRAYLRDDRVGQEKLWALIRDAAEVGSTSELNGILAEMQK